MYPEYMEIEGKEYKINTDYRVALACFRAINDDEIGDYERSLAIVTLLLGEDFPFELVPLAIEKCCTYLRCGKEENTSEEEIDMDYEQDKGRIMASFRSCYQMDINKENICWWEFNDLIEGLKPDDVLNRVRRIRQANPDEISNEKERQELIEAQKRLAIKVKEKKSPRQKEIDEFWDKIIGGENDE